MRTLWEHIENMKIKETFRVLIVLVLFPVCPDFVLRYPPKESGTVAAAT
jgi:hypothetical protein